MKLSDFSVVNYRSITTARKIKTNNMTVLVGKNNEGKSNILRALTLAMDIMKIYSKDPRSLQIAVRPYLKNHYSWMHSCTSFDKWSGCKNRYSKKRNSSFCRCR